MAVREFGPAAWQLVQAVRPWLQTAADEGRPVVIGVSGGADSMALAAAVEGALRLLVRDSGWSSRERSDPDSRWSSRERSEPDSGGSSKQRSESDSRWSSRERSDRVETTVTAVIVDHGLQPGSAQIAATVEGHLAQIGLTAQVVSVDVDLTTGRGLEAAARDARLAALRQAAPGALVLLGHTLEDQAETVLLGLARGSGLRSIAGMAMRNDDVVRPLLGLRRATIVQACEEWGLPVWDDPHNLDPQFLRVRVRHELLPALDEVLGTGVVEALGRTADLARADAYALDVLAEHHLGEAVTDEELELAEIEGLPKALLSRVVRLWLNTRGVGSLSQSHTEAVLGLIDRWRGQGPIELPGAQVIRRGGRLLVRVGPPDSAQLGPEHQM